MNSQQIAKEIRQELERLPPDEGKVQELALDLWALVGEIAAARLIRNVDLSSEKE